MDELKSDVAMGVLMVLTAEVRGRGGNYKSDTFYFLFRIPSFFKLTS